MERLENKKIFELLITKGYEVHNKRILGNPEHTSEEVRNKDLIQEIALISEWMTVNHGIYVEISCDAYGEAWFAHLKGCSKKIWNDLDRRHAIATAHYKFNNIHKSKQDAFLCAIDYILFKLI